VKKSRLYWGFQKRGVVLGIILAIISTHPVSAQVLMGGGTYSQNFDLPANGGTANAWTDKVALPDTSSTFSTSFASCQACPQSRSVILLCATNDLSHCLPDFSCLAPRQHPFHAGPSLKGHTIVVF
jgi:hypothetical protein